MKKKRRSKFGGLNALIKAMPLPEHKVIKMDIAARVAWLKLCEGTATPEDYNTIAWAVNILEHGLAHLNNEDINSTIMGCAAKVSEALQRKLQTDSWKLGDENLQNLLDWHQQLLGLVTIGQLDKLVTEIEERRDREGKYIEVSTVSWEAVKISKDRKESKC